jgi:hypothetical protein
MSAILRTSAAEPAHATAEGVALRYPVDSVKVPGDVTINTLDEPTTLWWCLLLPCCCERAAVCWVLLLLLLRGSVARRLVAGATGGVRHWHGEKLRNSAGERSAPTRDKVERDRVGIRDDWAIAVVVVVHLRRWHCDELHVHAAPAQSAQNINLCDQQLRRGRMTSLDALSASERRSCKHKVITANRGKDVNIV